MNWKEPGPRKLAVSLSGPRILLRGNNASVISINLNINVITAA
jgi:hypothetical protein